jgi:hypothetical protein
MQHSPTRRQRRASPAPHAMTPKKSSNKQAARARSVPRRPRSPEIRAEVGALSADDDDEADTDREAVERNEDDEESEPDEVATALVTAKRKATPRNVPLPPPTPQRVAREGEEDELPDEVLEFVRAIDAYKRSKRRQFPSWSEVLDVLKQLGYERRTG